jgi:hypothetical protein
MYFYLSFHHHFNHLKHSQSVHLQPPKLTHQQPCSKIFTLTTNNMLSKQFIILAALAASTAFAVPVGQVAANALEQRTPTGVPEEVKSPPEGMCALMVFSSTILPIGGQPTTVSGDGIAPSSAGDPSGAIINSNRDIIGPAVPMKDPNKVGFANDIKLNNDKGSVHVTARQDFVALLT